MLVNYKSNTQILATFTEIVLFPFLYLMVMNPFEVGLWIHILKGIGYGYKKKNQTKLDENKLESVNSERHCIFP